MEEHRKIFARLGVTMTLTEREFDTLRAGDAEARKLVLDKVHRGDFELNGETYFHGTDWLDEQTWPHRDDFNFDF